MSPIPCATLCERCKTPMHYEKMPGEPTARGCYKCGNIEYLSFPKRMGSDHMGASHHHMTQKQRREAHMQIREYVMKGLSYSVIEGITHYSLSIIERYGKIVHKEMREGKEK